MSVSAATRASARCEASPQLAGLGMCRFCDQLEDPVQSAISQTVLAESPTFVAWPSIGALVPGWTLVVPRRHVLSLAELRDRELNELWRTRDEIRSRLERAGLGPTVSFEHGPSAPNQEVGCGVDHAHLHIVPSKADIVSGTEGLFPGIAWQTIDSFASAAAASKDGLAYLYLEDQQGTQWLAADDELPSQVIRRVIASDLGHIGSYNWRDHPEAANVERTVKLFAESSA